MQISLEVRRQGEAPRQLMLGTGITLIGRAPDNDLVLPDVGVSRRHARLVVRDGGVVLEDLGSGNGTFVRGERIRRHTVADGDEVVVDPFVIVFRVDGQPAAGPVEEEETALVDSVVHAVSAPGPRQARLVVLQGHGLSGSYALTEQGVSMGRGDDRDIVLQDPAASRMQADIRPQDEVFWLRDYGSANGTFVNGRRVRERPLQHGDRIRVGSTEFRFELQDVAAGDAVTPRPAAAAAPAPSHAAPPAPSHAAPPPAAPPPAAPRVPVAAHDVPPPPGAASAQVTTMPDPQARAPRARRSNMGVIVGVVVGLVLLGSTVAVAALGFVGWRVYQAQQAETVASASQATTDQPATPASKPAAAAPDKKPASADKDAAPASTTPAAAKPAQTPAPVKPAETPAAAKPAETPAAAKPAETPVAAKPAETPPAATAQAAAPAEQQPADQPVADAATEAVAEAPVSGTEALMDRGMQLFREGAYLEATALFYRALKREPTNVEAERMCYISCEFLALKQLREELRDRQLSPEERQQLYQDAVVMARRAIRGRVELDVAEEAIIAALEWFPDDGTLVELQRGVQARRARTGGSSSRSSSSTSSMPSGNARLAREYVDQGLQAIDDGRFTVARDRLTRALQMDPSLTAARGKLDDVIKVLDARAEASFKQARQLEAQGDTEGARAAYEQVITYAGPSQAQLQREARQRLSSLGAG